MKSALVISPFATAPLDAGHRRRTMQMTKLLADAGYEITFLLLAFEDPWYWRHDQDFADRLREQWPEVILLYADRRVGLPPKSGALHHLDEWWDPALEQMLTNLNSRRFFDVVVVHNVWLSKAFDFVHPNSFKVLETHDLFWKRSEVFARMGMKPEFFVTSQSSEVFGVRRADIAVTIQESEGVELLAKTDKPVVTVPFYDFSLESEARPASAAHYHSPDKVIFGALASDNPFNVAGLNALLKELEQVVCETFAPVEIVVGGRVGERIDRRAGVKCLGFVETEAGFYADVDFAIAPVFDGTGFKVKMADALALRIPTLLSEHAAEGVILDDSLVCVTPRDMARRMAEIALKRPPIQDAMTHIRHARHDLRSRVNEGAANLLGAISAATRPLVVNLAGASLAEDALAFTSWLATLRDFAGKFSVVLLLSEDALKKIHKYLPLGVKAMTPAELRRGRTWPRLVVIDVLGEADRAALELEDEDVILVDQRWRKRNGQAPGSLALDDMPLFSPNMSWEPAVLALHRARDKGEIARFKVPGRRTRIVFTDEPFGLDQIDLDGKTASLFVTVSDSRAVQAAILAVLDNVAAEVVWAASPGGVRHRAALEACALRGASFHGWLDDAAIGHGPLPPRFGSELGPSGGRVVAKFKKNLPEIEAN